MKYPFASILTFMKYDAIIAYLNYSTIKSQPFTRVPANSEKIFQTTLSTWPVLDIGPKVT